MKKKNNTIVPQSHNRSHFFQFVLVGILFLSIIQTTFGNSAVVTSTYAESSADQEVFRPDEFRVPQASADSILNATIHTNQTAYLPNSFANITLEIFNNFPLPIQSLSMNVSSFSDLILISGAETNELATLEVNQTFTRNLICQLPESSQSLDVVFLIDGSGSMTAEISEVKGKVQDLIDTLYANVSSVRVGIIFFGSTRYDENPYGDDRNVLDLTDDTDQIQSFLDPWTAGGGWEPWGDALHYLKQLDWQSSARLAILITDEPCNEGTYVKDNEDLYALAEELHELGIIVSTMQCYGGGEQLETQLTQIASITSGLYVKLESSSDELMENVLAMCYAALQEIGQQFIVMFSATINGTVETVELSQWILVDNNPPSLRGSILKILDTSQNPAQFRFRVICKVYDAAGVDNVSLFFKFNTTNYIETQMDYATWGTFSYLLPEIPEDSVVKYYFQATDKLGNYAETEIYEFVADYSITELNIPLSFQLVLGKNEGVLYKLDLSKLETEIKLLVIGDTSVYGNINYANNSEQAANWSLTSESPFKLLSFLPDNDTIYLSLTTLDEYADATITLAGSAVQNATINEYNQTINLSQFDPVRIYKVVVNVTIDTSFHVKAASDDDFEFLAMMVFNESTLVKSHIFNRISVTVETSGEYYVLLGLLDDRVDNVDLDVEISYGSIDDEPYWEVAGYPVAESAGIPGYNLFLIMAFIGTVVALLIKKPRT